jgi:hypothetical protein
MISSRIKSLKYIIEAISDISVQDQIRIMQVPNTF